MKTFKSLLALLTLVAFFASCEKQEIASEKTDDITERFEPIKKASVTVTTESALKAAVKNAGPGDVIKIKGTIYLTSTLQLINSGTSSNKINLYGENGVLDCSNVSGWGVKCNGSYWNIQHLDIKKAGDCGLVFQHGGNNYCNYVRTFENGDSGIQIYNGSHHNWIQNCWSWDNYDVANGGENADGFACKLSGGVGNVFYKCEASHNSDDGWDLYGQPYTVKMYNCIAMWHGYGNNGDGNGFKLGSAGQNVTHYVRYCSSHDNIGSGYDGNGNTGHMYTEGSGGYNNGKALWSRIY